MTYEILEILDPSCLSCARTRCPAEGALDKLAAHLGA
jgi:hypothetical protein